MGKKKMQSVEKEAYAKMVERLLEDMRQCQTLAEKLKEAGVSMPTTAVD